MKTLKQLTALFLIVALACSMAACSAVGKVIDSVSEPEKELSRGIVTGNTYKSEFVGIQCSLDENWEIWDDDQLAQLAGLTSAQIQNEDLKTVMENSSVVFDFYAQKDSGLQTLNVTLNDMKTQGIDSDSEDKIAEMALPEVQSMLTDAGFEGCTVEKESILFAGEQHPCYVISGTLAGMQVYEKMVLMIESDIVIYVTACSYLEDSTDTLLSVFTAY